MSGDRKGFGDFAERVAAHYLASRGCEILDRKWRCRFGEIDLVAREADTLVFVEVRARRSGSMGTAAESITPRKRAHLLAAAAAYWVAHPGLPEQRRIDLITVEQGERGIEDRKSVV